MVFIEIKKNVGFLLHSNSSIIQVTLNFIASLYQPSGSIKSLRCSTAIYWAKSGASEIAYWATEWI